MINVSQRRIVTYLKLRGDTPKFGLEGVDGVLRGVLDVLEAVPFKLNATKPAGDADDAVRYIFLLKDAENHHARTGFSIVALRGIDSSLMAYASCPAVVVCLGVGFLALEGF